MTSGGGAGRCKRRARAGNGNNMIPIHKQTHIKYSSIFDEIFYEIEIFKYADSEIKMKKMGLI